MAHRWTRPLFQAALWTLLVSCGIGLDMDPLNNGAFRDYEDLSLSAVSPVEGGRGTSLTLTGTGFADGMIVTVGQANCGNVTLSSPTEIACRLEAGDIGQKTVTLTRVDSKSFSGGSFRIKEYLYVTHNSSKQVSGFEINASDGSLTSLGSVAVGDAPNEVAVHPSGRSLYVTSSAADSVYAFQIDPATGALTTLGVTGAGDGAEELLPHPDGKWLYVANNLTDTVSIFGINEATGALTAASGSPYTLPGMNPASLSIHSEGNFLITFVPTPAGKLATTSINRSTGVLSSSSETSASGAFHTATSMGSFLFLVDSSGSITSYSVVNGVPAALGGSLSTTTGTTKFIVSPRDKFLYGIKNSDDKIYGASINSSGGLAAVPGVSFSTGDSPQSLAADPSGQYLYSADLLGNTISIFKIETSGSLTSLGMQSVSGGPRGIYAD